MKLSFTHLGPLESGEIELAPLTIICGENNTGKTYVTYVLYCLLKVWKELIDLDLRQELSSLESEGVIKIDLQEKIVNNWGNITEQVLKQFKKRFPEMLASKTELFAETDIEFIMEIDPVWKKLEVDSKLHTINGEEMLTIQKSTNDSEVTIASLRGEDKIKKSSLIPFEGFIQDELLKIVLIKTIPNVFIASTERTGATIFKDELNLAKTRILDLLNQVHKDGGKDSLKPGKIFETIYGKQDYALPVKDNVYFINQLPNENTEESKFYKNNPNLMQRFEEIVGGKYITTKNDLTVFRPKKTLLKLILGEVSSSVRSLLIVWYWLKYKSQQGDMLVLDEPELNLHPNNQRRLARFIVSLVNQGIKVFLTTHSDYIIKEINTLILLNSEAAIKSQLWERFKEYGYTETDRLSVDNVSLYYTGKDSKLFSGNKKKTKINTLIKAKIDPNLGIEVPTFDQAIDEMNKIQEEILFSGST